MLSCSKNINSIPNNTKLFRDKHGIGYSEKASTSKGCDSKLVKDSNQNSKLQCVVINERGKPFKSSNHILLAW